MVYQYQLRLMEKYHHLRQLKGDLAISLQSARLSSALSLAELFPLEISTLDPLISGLGF